MITRIKIIALFVVAGSIFSSCTKDSDVEYPTLKNILLSENFGTTSSNNLPTDWTSYAQVGTKLWVTGVYNGDAYGKFTSYQSGQPTNISWLISPAIDMDNKENVKLTFQTCHDQFVLSTANSLELYVSNDYDGTDFTAAHWVKTPYTGTQIYPLTDKYVYVNSGFVDLSAYKGSLHFAFKCSGTSSLTGSYQVDNVRVFY